LEQTTTEIPAPGATQELEACRSCGSLLAADQRYCLACGTRRGATRVPVSTLFTPPAEATIASVAATPAAPPATPAAARPAITPTAAAIASGAVVMALVAGLLIGRGEHSNTAAPVSATPVTVSVPSAGTAAAADQSAAAPPASAVPTAKDAKQAAKDGQKAAANKTALNSLQSTSGKDYSKKSAQLPKVITLPGKPPPKDNKPAGGGSKEVTIGG
jgi:hypothetical protein